LQMLAPVVTKEMQLFKLGPTNKNNLRNVRARAQSLNEGLGSGTKQQIQSARSVSAGGHRAAKSSMSVGNLPLLSGSPGSSGLNSTSSSPPKNFAVRKATLDPIHEGVELGTVSAPAIAVKKRSGSTPTSPDQPSVPGTLQKHATSDSLADKEEKKKKEGGVLGWLSKTFSKKSKSSDEAGTSRDSAEGPSTSSSSSVSGDAGSADSPTKQPAPKKR
ncbi:hypothetical protein PMAYCL1PPCAC_32016, partial [Pristionchus mayeri]